MGILSIITTLLPVLLSLLGETGVISPSLVALIEKLAAAIPGLVTGLIAGKASVTADSLVILQAIQTEINALKSSNLKIFSLNQSNEINAFDAAIAAAIAAFGQSQVIDDPSTLTPLPENL